MNDINKNLKILKRNKELLKQAKKYHKSKEIGKNKISKKVICKYINEDGTEILTVKKSIQYK